MMQALTDFFLLAMTAIFLENAIFTRALGTSRMLIAAKRADQIFAFGILITVITICASIFTCVINMLLMRYSWWYLVEPLCYVVCMCIVFLIVRYALKDFFPGLYDKVGQMLPLATFNGAVLGPLLLSGHQGYDFWQYLAFGLGSGIGYTMALLLVSEGQRRLRRTNLPRAFRGLPISLLYIGILSLGFYGLIGHQLLF